MSHVTKRNVTRYYANGKGYASKMYAYKKLAIKRLRTEVFGEDYEFLEPLRDKYESETPGYTEDFILPGGNNLTDQQRTDAFRRAWDNLMAERFPHDKSDSCICTCANGYPDIESKERVFEFKSCKYAIDKWVEEKARELMAEDEDVCIHQSK